MSGSGGSSMSWEELMHLFTEEIKSEKCVELWAKFKTLKTEEEMVQFVHDLDMFKKRINAWHSKHARSSAPANITASHSDPSGTPKRRGSIRDVVALTHGENPDFPGASSALELKWSKEKGRHVVATRDISPGDTLFLEDPFASVLCQSEGTHCEMCCLVLPNNPVRCHECVTVTYCSQLCLAQAAHQYHTFECGSNLSKHVGIARLGLRVTLVAESLGCLGNEPWEEAKQESLPGQSVLAHELKARCKVGESRCQQYSRVLDLVTHLEDMEDKDKFWYTLTALLLVVDQARRRKVPSSQRPMFTRQFGGRVLRHIAQLVCNGNAITSYIMQDHASSTAVVKESQWRVATAIFPSSSMMNHSCDPNIQTSYFGRTLIAQASKPILAGQEVYNCYGPHYRTTKTKERKVGLKQQYLFDCQCGPCMQPMDFLDKTGIDANLCPECQGPAVDRELGLTCLECGHQLTTEQVMAIRILQGKTADVMHNADQMEVAEDTIPYVEEALNLQMQFLHHNNRKICECLDHLGMLHAMAGREQESLTYLERSLPLLEKWHGDGSVELAGVLDTMLDVAGREITRCRKSGDCCTDLLTKTLNWCERAMKIVSVLLGPWHQRMQSLHATYQQLQKMQTYTSAQST